MVYCGFEVDMLVKFLLYVGYCIMERDLGESNFFCLFIKFLICFFYYIVIVY